MLAYTIRRLLISIPVLIAASFLTFWFVSLSGDPVLEKFAGRNPRPPKSTFDHEYHRLHLDQGFFAQYWGWLKNLVTQGYWGPSVNETTDIGHELARGLGVTIRLVTAAMLIALILAVITGVLSAVRQYSKTDYTFTFLGFLFLAMPSFWIAVLLKQGGIFVNDSLGTRIFYTIGEKSTPTPDGFWDQTLDTGKHMILPTISLALITYAAWSRFQRASMLEVLNSDYVRLARAKGLKPRRVLVRHGLRTALIPMTTVTALTIAAILGGAVITETVFGWQGMGRFLIQEINLRDRYGTMGWLLVSGFFVIAGNLVADLLYAVLDPRIRYE
jgi:peptide/nickel transport system permease protein